MPNLKALHRLSLFLILSLLANSSQALEIAMHDMHDHREGSTQAVPHDNPDSHGADESLSHSGADSSHPDYSRAKSTDHSEARLSGDLTGYPTDDSTDYSTGYSSEDSTEDSTESIDDCLCAELCGMSLVGFSFAAAGHSHYPGISFNKRLPDHYQSISLDPLRPPPNH